LALWPTLHPAKTVRIRLSPSSDVGVWHMLIRSAEEYALEAVRMGATAPLLLHLRSGHAGLQLMAARTLFALSRFRTFLSLSLSVATYLGLCFLRLRRRHAQLVGGSRDCGRAGSCPGRALWPGRASRHRCSPRPLSRFAVCLSFPSLRVLIEMVAPLPEDAARVAARACIGLLQRATAGAVARRAARTIALCAAQHPAAVGTACGYRGVAWLAAAAGRLAPRPADADALWVGSPAAPVGSPDVPVAGAPRPIAVLESDALRREEGMQSRD
jgi:hypothetical protein